MTFPEGIVSVNLPLSGFDKESMLLDELGDSGADCILMLTQPWKSQRLIKLIRKHFPETKLALYVPVEGRPNNDVIANSMAIADQCIVYTRAVYEELKNKDLRIAVIGHGIDSLCKQPVSARDRNMLRQTLFPSRPKLWKSPLILNMNRMYFRKRFDLCIAGYAEASQHIEANLYLHIPGISRYERSKLERQIDDLDIQDRVYINTLNRNGRPLGFDKLVMLMQACDVGITTAMGEGWGLGTFEHAATGAAQIVPDHIGFRENWGPDKALFIPCDAPVPIWHEQVDMYPPSISGIAETIIRIFRERELIDLMSERALNHLNNRERDWCFIGKQFDSVLEALIS